MSHGPLANELPDLNLLDLVASPVFVLQADASGQPCYVAFNAHARAISGRPLSDYVGKTALDVYPGAYGRTAFERHCEIAESGTPMTYQLELPLAGKTRSIRTTLLPRLSKEGRVSHMFGTSVDLTTEQHTREAQVSFKTIATEMEQFVAMAAHDLRAPMRNMAMIADMLSEGFVDQGDGKVELIAMIDEVAQKSMSLITDVLDHARAVDSTDQTSKFNFAALCRDICDILDPLEQHRITYTAVELNADRTALQIAIRNILENAMKHGGHDQLQIDVTIEPGNDGMLDVIISDTGQGFPDAALAFLNGGTFKVDSGYGLLGVRRMVQARGGTMTAQNKTDVTGAVIQFSIPGQWVGLTCSLGDLVPDWADLPSNASPKTA